MWDYNKEVSSTGREVNCLVQLGACKVASHRLPKLPPFERWLLAHRTCCFKSIAIDEADIENQDSSKVEALTREKNDRQQAP